MNGTMMIIHSAYLGFQYTSATVQAQIRFNDAYISIEGPATQNNKPYKIRLDGTDIRINGLKQYGGAFSTDKARWTSLPDTSPHTTRAGRCPHLPTGLPFSLPRGIVAGSVATNRISGGLKQRCASRTASRGRT